MRLTLEVLFSGTRLKPSGYAGDFMETRLCLDSSRRFSPCEYPVDRASMMTSDFYAIERMKLVIFESS